MKMTAMLTVAALFTPLSSAHGQGPQRSFRFDAASVRGIESGEVFITGSGTFDPVAGVVQAGGSFSLHAIMFVSAADEDDAPWGAQTVWIQGVGCGAAVVHLH